MTVSELISELQKLPPTMRVMVNGYEGGLCDPTLSEPVVIDLDAYDSDVYGPHALVGTGWETPSGLVEAVILKRDGR